MKSHTSINSLCHRQRFLSRHQTEHWLGNRPICKTKRWQSKKRLQEPRPSKQETDPSLKKSWAVLLNLIYDHFLPGSLWCCISEKFQRIQATVGPILLLGATETALSLIGSYHRVAAPKSLQRMESECQSKEGTAIHWIHALFHLNKSIFQRDILFNFVTLKLYLQVFFKCLVLTF